MTASTTTTTSVRGASGWSLALCAAIALVVGAGVGGISTAALTDEASAPVDPGPRAAAVGAAAQSPTAVGDLVSPDALEHRIAAGGSTAVVAPPAAAGAFSADAAERLLTADAADRLEGCTAVVVAADAVEHCLAQR